ncbi:MAG TPA: MotA/TolQ/ExbB proton channel family protein [Flavobacteriaceae bacterium]|nr:MotA/TolQ/ExbB proton channel family protein [Flavobacteriaceae bacterium]
MKRLFSILVIATIMAFLAPTVNANNIVQDTTAQAQDTTQMQQTTPVTTSADEPAQTEETVVVEDEPTSFHQGLKQRFIEGGPGFMGIVLLALILGLAISIERIIYLNMSTTNTKKLAERVEDALNSGGTEAALEVCRNTKGPVASIYYQGISRVDTEGIDAAEKAVVAYGGVQMGQLEKNVSWISLFIALGPMLGFLGTVIGMIIAFDKIEAAGDMNPALVAGGIKVALLTTVFGLIVAMILQVFYNYIIAKIDSIVNDMENASILLVDMLVEYKSKKQI